MVINYRMEVHRETNRRTYILANMGCDHNTKALVNLQPPSSSNGSDSW
jgi:hypothetical protein